MNGMFRAGALLAALLTVSLFLSCSQESGTSWTSEGLCPESGRGVLFDDRDGRSYPTVTIGDQVWMAENLDHPAEKSLCYDSLDSNCSVYGRLYYWSAAMKACPSGWHLPDAGEWEILAKNMGGEGDAGRRLKSSAGWAFDGNGTDDCGFDALPGGVSAPVGFLYSTLSGIWWTSTRIVDSITTPDTLAYDVWIHNTSSKLFINRSAGAGDEEGAESVRCIRDAEAQQ